MPLLSVIEINKLKAEIAELKEHLAMKENQCKQRGEMIEALQQENEKLKKVLYGNEFIYKQKVKESFKQLSDCFVDVELAGDDEKAEAHDNCWHALIELKQKLGIE